MVFHKEKSFLCKQAYLDRGCGIAGRSVASIHERIGLTLWKVADTDRICVEI